MWLCVLDYSTAVCPETVAYQTNVVGMSTNGEYPWKRRRHTLGQMTKRMVKQNLWGKEKSAWWHRHIGSYGEQQMWYRKKCDGCGVQENHREAQRSNILLPSNICMLKHEYASKQKYHEISPTEVHAVTLSWAPLQTGWTKGFLYTHFLIPLSLRGTENLLMALFQSPDEASYKSPAWFCFYSFAHPFSFTTHQTELSLQNTDHILSLYVYSLQVTSQVLQLWFKCSAKFMRVSQPNPCPFHSLLSSPWSCLSAPAAWGFLWFQ